MNIPRILLVITHEPADKDVDGSMTTGFVKDVYSNLPARYFDIVVHDWRVTERDDAGCVSRMACDTQHPRGEAPFRVLSDLDDAEDAREGRPRNDGIEEWSVMFYHRDEIQRALVLKAPDVIAAALRVKQEFPLCRIVHIDEEWAEQEHPMALLDQYEIILPVGGPRVPKVAEGAQ